jgi:tetratricopeptide (TPR) repeat protein
MTAPALLARAHCYCRLHNWDAAAADLQRAAWLAPNDPLVRQANTDFNRLSKFLADVRDLDRELAAAPNDGDLLADRALLFLRAHAPELALADATRALKLAPAAIRPRLFAALALRAENQNAAADRLAVSSSFQLQNVTPDFLQTLRQLDAEIGADPKDPELRVNRAWQLNEIGQPELALADAEAAIAFDSRCAGARAEAGYALAKLGRDAEASTEVKRATELDPNFSTAWQYRGELEMRRGDDLAAVDSLTHALAINETAAALAKREECYRKLGFIAKAEEDRRSRDKIRTIR